MSLDKNSIGSVLSIYICASAGEPMQKVTKVHSLKDQGLEGDRYSAGKGYWQNVSNPRECVRDVSVINARDIENSNFTEAETRRNIVVKSNIQLTELIGKQFYIGSVLFLGTEDCAPCRRPSDLSGKANFAAAFKVSGGLRAKVLSTGDLHEGDLLRIAPLSESL